MKASTKHSLRAAGRPTVFSSDCLRKLIETFKDGGNKRDACIQAGVSESAFYDFLRTHPGFLETIDRIQNNHILIAKRTIIKSLSTEKRTAQWFLERKARDEFGTRASDDVPEIEEQQNKKEKTVEEQLDELRKLVESAKKIAGDSDNKDQDTEEIYQPFTSV